MKGITAALYMDLYEDLLPFCTLEGAPEQSSRSIACCALRDNLTKKLVSEVADNADERALAKFLSVNSDCRDWQLDVETLQDELLVNELRSVLHKFFDENSTTPILSDFQAFARFGTLGPGKSIGSTSEDFYTKLFDSELTTTSSGLYRMYADYISQHPLWAEAENIRRSHRGEARVVRGNRLTFVPKSDDISRTICIEPVLNMFYQQGVRHVLEERLRTFFGIDLATQQEKNRRLAQIASERSACSQPGDSSLLQNLCTIDLSSASDSLGLRMLEAVMPRFSLDVLKLFRCAESELPNGGGWVRLEMISTMGNAFTFPLQTALFASIVVAAARVSGLGPKGPKDGGGRSEGDFGTYLIAPRGTRLGTFGVNGDDIICPQEIADKVLRLLKLLGFKVNSDKTFGTHNSIGYFRESCGADYYSGTNVRPVFAKKLETPQDLYSLINRLNVWSVVQGVPLRRTLRRLLKAVPRLEVPPWESDDCGIKIPLLRWCRYAPRRVLYGSILYRKRVAQAPKALIDMETECILVPRGMKPLNFNREGLYLAFLRGTIVNGTITLRPRVPRYTTKVGVAPNWEFNPTMPNSFGSAGGPALEKLAWATFE